MAERETNETKFYYKGFKRPTTTPVPDDIFDVIAPELTEAELRVLLYIVRRTFGFKKDADSISLTQMVKGITTKDGRVLDNGTGMSRRGVMKGVAGLLEKGVITIQREVSPKGGPQVNVYSLHFQDEEEKEGVGNEIPYPRELSSLGVGNEVDLQQTVYNKQLDNNNVVVALTDRRVHKRTAKRLVGDYPTDRVLEKIELHDYLLEHNPRQLEKNPAGFLIRAIEEDYTPPRGFKTKAEREAEAAEKKRREEQILKQREVHQKATDWREIAISKYQISEELLETWTQTLDQLQYQMTRATFATWLEHTLLLSLDDQTALVGVQSNTAREWIANRLYRPVQRTLATVLHREIKLEFEVL